MEFTILLMSFCLRRRGWAAPREYWRQCSAKGISGPLFGFWTQFCSLGQSKYGDCKWCSLSLKVAPLRSAGFWGVEGQGYKPVPRFPTLSCFASRH